MLIGFHFKKLIYYKHSYWSKLFVYCTGKPIENWSLFIKAIHHTFCQFTNVITHLRSWGTLEQFANHTPKASDLQTFSSVFLTFCVGFDGSKAIESAVYFLEIYFLGLDVIQFLLKWHLRMRLSFFVKTVALIGKTVEIEWKKFASSSDKEVAYVKPIFDQCFFSTFPSIFLANRMFHPLRKYREWKKRKKSRQG